MTGVERLLGRAFSQAFALVVVLDPPLGDCSSYRLWAGRPFYSLFPPVSPLARHGRASFLFWAKTIRLNGSAYRTVFSLPTDNDGVDH